MIMKGGNKKMKTLIATLAVVSLIAVGTMAFAHGQGGMGGGRMGGHGYGNHMMDSGYGGQMMGPGYGRGGGPGLKADQEFLDKTVEMRKALHSKKFEYREAERDPETANKDLTRIEKEIFDIQTSIREIRPRSVYGGYGPCWNR
jgi:hypothetical protein